MRKKRSHLPKLALMSSLYMFQAQAGVVNPDQQDWMWKDVPVKQDQQNQSAGPSHSEGGSSNALMWYMLGNMMGSNNGSSGSNFSSSGSSKQAPARPNPDTSHWNNNSNKSSSSGSGNSSSSSNSNKGYSTGGMGTPSSGKSGFSSSGSSSSGGG